MSVHGAGAVALALVVGALASRLGSGVRCPAGMICAAEALSGDEIAAMPEPCVGQIAADARRLRARGFNAAVFPVQTHADADGDELVAPSILARKVARATALAHAASITPLVALAGTGGRCDTEADRWFVRAYRAALAVHRRDDPTLTARVYCAGAGSLQEIDVRDPTRLADFTRGDAPVEATAAGVAGFVGSAAEEVDRIRNGDFSRGWDGWSTAGRIALAVPDGGRPDVCAPLIARLAPGASIAQPVRLTAPTGAATLELHVTSAPIDRRVSVALGRDERRLLIPIGAVVVSIALPDTVAVGDGAVVTLAVPHEETAPIELRTARLLERSPTGFDPVRPAGLAGLLGRWSSARDASANPLAVGPHRRVALADVLPEARVTTSNELSARVARELLDDETAQRPAIFEHPGSLRPTTIRWRLPAASCPRRLTAEVALAADCRGVSNGVDFAAESGDRMERVHVGGNDAAKPFELAVDALDAASFPAVELVLRTSAGEAHDARCDWALWIEPEVSCTESAGEHAPPPAARRLNLATLGDPVPLVTRWDETNIWKLYAYFGPAQALRVAQAGSPGWLRRLVPWVTHARVLGATGGNTCRHIHADCAAGRETADHPFPGRCWEGQQDRALRNEILHDDGPEEVLDASTWRASIDDLLASGLLPHVNVSAVPCALADGHDYRIYHWNQRPVRHHDAWRAFLHHLATAIASEPSWPEWRFSITNEPNCLWIDGARDPAHVVEHVGFAGTVDEYAEHVVETVQAMRAVLPDMRVQLGNFTIGGKHALEDNLPEYLGALVDRLLAAGVAPRDFSALSFSLYETPQHGLADLGPYKFGRLRRWIDEASPLHGIPKKLDEAEIHPMVAAAFEERTRTSLDATRWAAAWHADLLALAMREGVVSVAPWLKRLFADEDLTQPLAKYWTYALASLATGDVRPASGALLAPGALVPSPADQPRNGLVSVHAAATDADGLGWIVTREPESGVTWVMAWRHDETPTPDDLGAPPLALHVTLPPAARACVEALTIAGDDGEPWRVAPWEGTPVRARGFAATNEDLVVELVPESIRLLRIAPPGHPHERPGAPDTSCP